MSITHAADHVSALIARGLRLQQTGRFAEAEAAWRKVLRIQPTQLDALVLLGTAAYQQREWAAAEEWLTRAAKIGPDRIDIRCALGRALRAGGKAEEALACFLKVVEQRADHAEAHLFAGMILRGLGRIAEAGHHLETAVRLQPGAYEAHVNLGNCRKDAGSLAAAVACFQRAAEIAPRAAPAHFNLGVVLAELGQPAGAEAAYREAIRADPGHVEAHFNLGNMLARRQDWEPAAAHFAAAVHSKPNAAEAWVQLGACRAAQAQWADAAAAYEMAIALGRDEPHLHLALASAWDGAGRLEESRAACARATERFPDSAAAWCALGNAMLRIGDNEAALAHYRHVKALEPDHLEARVHEGIALDRLGRYDDAARCFDDIIGCRELASRADPEYAGALVFHGMALQAGGRFAEALQAYEHALRLDPERKVAKRYRATALHGLGKFDQAMDAFKVAVAAAENPAPVLVDKAFTHLMRGEFSIGWQCYEARKQAIASYGKHFDVCPAPEWQGEPLAGKTLLIHAEQGIGDEIMFASVWPALLVAGARLVATCSPKLEGVFRASFPDAQILAVDGAKPDWIARLADALSVIDPPDYQALAGSVAGRLRPAADTFAAPHPYLACPAALSARWRDELDALGPGLKIGLSWIGGTMGTGRARRSLALEQLLPVLRTPRTRFVSLQYTDCRAELEMLARDHGVEVIHRQDAIDDYAQTAGLISALDCVVSVCTAVIHLAGAMGKPVLVMTPRVPEWRYGYRGDRMRWYPEVHLFRQQQDGDWQPVIAGIANALQLRAANADSAVREG